MAAKKYHLKVSEDSNHEGLNVTELLKPDELNGIIMAGLTFFDDPDRQLNVYNAQMRPIRPLDEIKKNNVILLEGEAAFDFADTGKTWSQSLRDSGLRVGKKYAAQIDGWHGNYIVQFDDKAAFVKGFNRIANLFHEKGSDFLRDIEQIN